MSVKSGFRGWIGETRSIIAKRLFLSSSVYTDINNVTLLTTRGTTQIDHVIVSRHGVFVVESKNMRGRILGGEFDKEWTKVLPSHSFKFQNPLYQNYAHTKALSEVISVGHHKIFSVVMFWGNCRLGTPLPPNVLMAGYTDYIKSKKFVVFDDREVKRIVATIKQRMLPRTRATRRHHIAHLKQRFDNPCPRCRSPLTLRTARTGGNAGGRFFGCTSYPACTYTRNAPPTRGKRTIGWLWTSIR